jgi:hypothetical protein
MDRGSSKLRCGVSNFLEGVFLHASDYLCSNKSSHDDMKDGGSIHEYGGPLRSEKATLSQKQFMIGITNRTAVVHSEASSLGSGWMKK